MILCSRMHSCYPQVENKSSEFSLMVVHDSGAMEQLDPSDSPLAIRLKLGPSEVCIYNNNNLINVFELMVYHSRTLPRFM